MLKSWLLYIALASGVYLIQRASNHESLGSTKGLDSFWILSYALGGRSSSLLTERIQLHNKLPSAKLSDFAKSNIIQPPKPSFYKSTIKWISIPMSLGLAYFAIAYYNNVEDRETLLINDEKNNKIVRRIEISAYRSLPLNAVSRWWGYIHSIDLPISLRKPLFSLYCKSFGCNLDEAVDPDLRNYKNLGEFFRRAIREDVRPVAPGNCVVSPADGIVLHLGPVDSNHVEQVKGIQYPLQHFLGPNTWNNNNSELEEYYKSLLMKGGSLYHCVIYLAPGDYHRFHSPANWTVTGRRHFPGALLSVCPGIASWIPGLFYINERVIYTGEWENGFFSMSPVGATNVGSIKVYFDESLTTNMRKRKCRFQYKDLNIDNINLSKGLPFGEFNLGSTIVMLFEAPPNSKFLIEPGQKVKYGQQIFIEADDNISEFKKD